MTLIDTSAWIEFLRRRGDPTAKQRVSRLLEANLAAYTCPVRFELLSGAKAGEEAHLAKAFQFSRHVPFTPEDWPEAATLERRLRREGLTIPRDDLFVITVALRTGFAIACRDAHFDRARQVVGERLKVSQV